MLTQRIGFSLALAIITVASWWYLADYYLAQLLPDWYSEWVSPEWVDLFSTLIPSACLLSVFSVITRLQISEGLQQNVTEVSSQQNPGLFCNDTLRAMLLLMVPRYQGIAQRYVFWLQGNLAGLGSWLRASWVIVLWLFLILPPLHSCIMEHIATFIRRTPPYFCCLPGEPLRAPDEIFNVRNRVGDVEAQKFVTYRLNPGMSNHDWSMPPDARADTHIKESGTLIIYVGDFPHLHHRIKVRCSLPDCGFPGLPAKREKELPVRAGKAEFDFLQPPRGTHLNVDLVLLTHSGQRLDWAVVEPKGDR